MKRAAKIIVFVVLGLLILIFFWPCEDRRAGVHIFVTKGETSKDYRSFIKEVVKVLKESKELGLIRIYEVWVKYEKAPLTVNGGLKDYWVISLYVEGQGPLDWFAAEELSNNQKLKKEKAREFVNEILLEIEEIEEIRDIEMQEMQEGIKL